LIYNQSKAIGGYNGIFHGSRLYPWGAYSAAQYGSRRQVRACQKKKTKAAEKQIGKKEADKKKENNKAKVNQTTPQIEQIIRDSLYQLSGKIWQSFSGCRHDPIIGVGDRLPDRL
jgi:hypothetical protein